MKIDTVIFDLDGTLLNTLDDLHACFNHAIKEFGYPERTKEEIRNFVGNGVQKALERALPENISQSELEKVVDCFKKYYSQNMNTYTKPYDGIEEMLKDLQSKGFKLGIVSNKFDDAVKALSKKYFGSSIAYAVGEGYGIRRKPEADGVNKVLSELKSKKENAIYVGDSEVDIQTAENSNLPCISVLWGFKDKDFLVKNGARYIAKTPKDIISIIENEF